MKILAVGSHIIPETNKQSQVDWWRVGRPLRELAKHTDWQIDHSATFIPGFDKYKDLEEFTSEEMEKAFEVLCQYDIVFSSYHPDPTAYTMLKVARDKAGVQFVMDCDDDMFSINPDNPFWLKMTDEKVYWMQRMIADNDWLTTPSPVLAREFRKRRNNKDGRSVTVIPNFISKDYRHPKLVHRPVYIGYFGGASHYADLHESGVLPAIEQLMNENKNVRFKSVGMVVDKYIPRGRFEFEEGKRGTEWLYKVFPSLKLDIAIGPLLDNVFNRGKSNIKWQEATRAGAAFVASNVGPYASIRANSALLVENTRADWYAALKSLVDDKQKRLDLVAAATTELEANWQLEDQWVAYKDLFERVYKAKEQHASNYQTS